MLVPIEMLVIVDNFLSICIQLLCNLQAETAPRAEATTADRSDTEKNAFKFFQEVAGKIDKIIFFYYTTNFLVSNRI